MTTNRSNVVLVIVVVAAIAMASVVAVRGHSGAGATAQSTYGAENPAAAGLADTSGVASSTGSGLAAVDPAKQDPTLDQFTSRNPFIQATAVPTTGPSASPTPSSSPSPTGPAANIRIGSPSGAGTYTLQRVGAELPPDSSVFKITAISTNGVAFTVVNGYKIAGSSSTSIGPLPESLLPTPVTVEKGSKETAYSITVMWIGTASSSSTSGGEAVARAPAARAVPQAPPPTTASRRPPSRPTRASPARPWWSTARPSPQQRSATC